jgi:hypothetical protein
VLARETVMEQAAGQASGHVAGADKSDGVAHDGASERLGMT